MEWIQQCEPSYQPPYHLKDYVDLLEGAPRSRMRAMISVPIRHYKTWTTIFAIAWWLKKDPTLRIIYMTYSIVRAEEVGKDIRDICRSMGVGPTPGRDTIKTWRNDAGGGVSVMSADMSKLGTDCDILVWDDPIEGPEQADDARVRHTVNKTIAFYTNRLQGAGSCIGIMSRFHPDDPIGRRIGRDWRYIHKRAIEDMGLPTERAFAPDVLSLEEIKAKRAEMILDDPNERIFWGQWQNEPRADALSSFRIWHRYAQLPPYGGYVDAGGVDMSFSKAKRADWAAICVGRWYRNDCYMRYMRRVRADLFDLQQAIEDVYSQFGKIPFFSYVSGPERGAIQHLAMCGINVQPKHAGAPKFVRAQRTINNHNAGRIMWPNEGWVDKVKARFENFRGNEEDPDDEVDALVSMHDCMSLAGDARTAAVGQRRM